MSIDDVPSPIDFHNLQDVEAWIARTTTTRPWRTQFFDVFVKSLNRRFDHPICVLELGSGPGFLAEQVLQNCSVLSYTAIDFSAVMHRLAREKLKPFRERVQLVERDFRHQDWTVGLGPFDAIISLQAVHEVRHKRRVPGLLSQISTLFAQNGLFLFCDHYLEPDKANKNEDLFLPPEEQPMALHDAGFSEITCLLDQGGMALYAATRRA